MRPYATTWSNDLLALLVAVGVVLFLAACQGTAVSSESDSGAGAAFAEIASLPTLDPAQVALGQSVYATHCASCHGENLEGEADWKRQNADGSFRSPPHDASGHTWHHGDTILLEAIELGGARLPESIGGRSDMPAFAELLTVEEIRAVLTFIKSRWPDDIRALQQDQTKREP